MIMAWFLLLLIFWKPLYWGVMAIYYKIKTDDLLSPDELTRREYRAKIKGWFKQLLEIVKPVAGDM
jgi:hypothetical protein